MEVERRSLFVAMVVPSRSLAPEPPKVQITMETDTTKGTMSVEFFDSGDAIDVNRHDIVWGDSTKDIPDMHDTPLDVGLDDEAFNAYASVLEGISRYKMKPVKDSMTVLSGDVS